MLPAYGRPLSSVFTTALLGLSLFVCDSTASTISSAAACSLGASFKRNISSINAWICS
jgi:hypothetical protein